MDLLAQINSHYGNGFKDINLIRDWIGLVYEVTNDNKKYIIKIFRNEYTKQALQSVEVMTYLKDNSFPVPCIIKTLSGHKHFIYNHKVVVLYEYVAGESVDKANNLITIGEQSGWMRRTMESYTGDIDYHGYNFFINRYLDIMKMKEYPGMNRFAEMGYYLWESVKDLPSGFIHGDLHEGNMFHYKNEIIFFDFDACAIASPAYDIATLCDATDYFDLSADNFEKGFNQTKNNVMEFLKGYAKYFSLSKEEEIAIFKFIAIRHFDIQATIIDSQGLACVDNQFLDDQYSWLAKWLESIVSGGINVK